MKTYKRRPEIYKAWTYDDIVELHKQSIANGANPNDKLNIDGIEVVKAGEQLYYAVIGYIQIFIGPDVVLLKDYYGTFTSQGIKEFNDLYEPISNYVAQ